MFWSGKLKKINKVEEIKKLPPYGFLFVLRNLGPFKLSFIILSILSSISAILSFSSTLLLSDIFDNVLGMTANRLISFYLPVYAAIIAGNELVDYFVRKYGDAFPENFVDYSKIRIYKSILASRFQKILGFSKERLNELISRYLGGIHRFLSDWFWNVVRMFVSILIILTILYIQSPIVLIINVAYLSLFFLVSLRISRKFSNISSEYSKTEIDRNSVVDSFTLNLNSVKKLGITGFFEKIFVGETLDVWKKYKKVRDFHANRWFIQLNLFNFIRVGTMFWGIYEVIQGDLNIGFLLLINWAFGKLWGIMVYIVEYWVVLIQQKENTKIINRELNTLLISSTAKKNIESFKSLYLKNVEVSFEREKSGKLKIEVPEFKISRGDKVGIVGKTGSGKSTVLNVILDIIDYEGDVVINDDASCSSCRLDPSLITLITNQDPFFNLSLKQNILLGTVCEDKKLDQILEGLCVNEFVDDLAQNFGSAESNFSAGEMQRLRLARGVVQDSDVYLLDEAFNGIDQKTKKKIMSFLKKVWKDKTVVLVTHSEEELEIVDEVYRMEANILSAVQSV